MVELKKVHILKIWVGCIVEGLVWFEYWLDELKKVQKLMDCLDVRLKVWFGLVGRLVG